MHTQDLTALIRLRRSFASGEAQRLRVAAGVSLRRAAVVCACDPSVIARWEKGERNPHGEAALRYELLLRELAATLGASS